MLSILQPRAFALVFLVVSASAEPESAFEKEVLPLLEHYCYRCHGGEEKIKGDVDLTKFKTESSLIAKRKLWLEVLHQIRSEEMPTKEPLPSREERLKLTAWLDHKLNDIDWSKVRDAGHVTIPRLTKVEYNNTMRDLLGIDVQPGAAFSEDGEGQSGFTTDRENLFVTPALMEKYFAAAERALDSVIALDADPMERHLESEDMFMTETREQPKDFGNDFRGYVLNRGQMTLYDSIDFPFDGLYAFSVRALATGGSLSGARLRINDEVKGDIVVRGEDPTLTTITCFVPKGSHQVAWNIERPKLPPAPKTEPEPEPARQQTPQPNVEYTKLPRNAGKRVRESAAKNAPRFELLAGESSNELASRVKALNRALNSLQRPYEWLRLHGPNGDPAELRRFHSSIVDRRKTVDQAFDRLAKAMRTPRPQLEKRFKAANLEALAANAKLFAVATDALRSEPTAKSKTRTKRKPKKKAGNIAIDWMEVRGPLKPVDAKEKSTVLHPRPGNGITPESAAREIIDRFARRAFRRPLAPAETDRYVFIYRQAVESDQNFEQAVKLALTGILVSPNFLFRNELAPPDRQNAEFPLDDYQIASRLSYFLWMSMPDDELFELASAGKLREPEILRSQVRRLLKDPKARSFTSAFLGQWLGYESLGVSVIPDREMFPEFDVDLATAMKDEAVLAFEHLIRKDRSLLALLDSDATFLNARLARHYGIDGVEGDNMRPVTLTDRNRGGLLGMASVLTATSSPTRTSPVLRGKWVVETLLGERIPDPPPDAGQLDADAGKKRGKTLREELEIHRSKPDCARCHDKIDPIGFGLENFDAIGRYRTEENGKAIDNSGELSGFAFSGAAELKAWLRNERKDAFVRNVTERMLAFALGRRIETFDEGPLRKIMAALESNSYRASTLVEEIVLSYPFLHQNNAPPKFD